MSGRRLAIGGVAAACAVVLGIALFTGLPPGTIGGSGGIYPAACAKFDFSAARCRAIVARARNEAHVAQADVTVTRLQPFAPAVTLGGSRVAVVEFDLEYFTTVRQEVWCVGVSSGSDRVCDTDPQIGIETGVDHDIPCPGGDPPAGCATHPPSPRQASVVAAEPLLVPAMDIVLDHAGHYEVEVGAASLPDGALSERSAKLADVRPTAFWIDEGIRIEVRSDIPGRPPIGSVYRDPFDGVEPVHVFLVFDAVDVQAGAVLRVRDLVVR